MKCRNCGIEVNILNAALFDPSTCKDCDRAEAKERRKVNWFGLTNRQANEKDDAITKKFTKYQREHPKEFSNGQ